MTVNFDLCIFSRYLCEYVYYTSLSHDSSRALFVHIPPYSEHDNLQDKVNTVKDIIKYTFLHLYEKQERPKDSQIIRC